ncbi:MAG: sigma-54-dependent Fis family transcriptional regulator [Verrucomicrobiales bacterium]|nr:sigma-54-dependent Fis family transcriptional regulator [Verrucomicrobiales bacterium]MCP5528035.1 sigma-54-dependent Fis family transcriptional regulator [Verrucomicrobiales bacterium]
MKNRLPPLLFVDDERNMRRSFEAIMAAEGYEVVAVESAEDALKELKRGEFFMVITDARLGGMSGYELLREIRSAHPDLAVVMITAYATPKLAVEAIKSGAIDYLAKPFAPEELLHAVARCAERHSLLHENAALRARDADLYTLDQIIGESPRMQALRQLIKTVAPTDATVLILGESGTGKELIAGALHGLSKRRDQKYIRLNCAAIPETLLESELFGHEKGAFTGAVRQKIGRVEEADGGTIFLDEIGDMSRPLQAKLLRFLEDGSFTRVGGNEELRVKVRLIAATNRDIVTAIRQDAFREDLFHRLNVVQFQPPPLRERGRDIILLAEHFLRQFAAGMNKSIQSLTLEAEQKLLDHSWPGNVRELRNAMERAVILEARPEIQADSLPDFGLEARLRRGDTEILMSESSLEEHLTAYERRLIRRVLEMSEYNLTRTAAQLRIPRHALRQRIQRLGIEMTESLEPEESPPKGA